MFSSTTAILLDAAFVTVMVMMMMCTGVRASYRPVSACYSSGLLIKCAHSVTCDHHHRRLQCDQDHVIRVHDADYGRRDYSTCAAGRHFDEVQNVFCSSPAATDRVANMCNGRNSCIIRASSSVFGNPCPGTSKYLQVSYFCEPLKKVCEHHTGHLSCASGKTIRIHEADYGRRNHIVCAAGRPSHQLRNVNCRSAVSTYKVAQMCNGKRSCSVTASNSVFGDPCRGTYKYLQLSYFCV